MAKAAPTLTLFRNPTFRTLWVAALASNFGGLVQAVGAAWMMTSLTSSQSMVALVQSSVTLPIMVLSLLAGVFADNFDRRRVMLVAQSFMLAVSVLLAIMAFEELLTPALLLTFTFLIGCGTALHNPSWQASMGDIVARDQLSSAVSLNSMGFNLMRCIGPAAGGLIVATAGAAVAFAVNAFSYVAIISALWSWRPAYPERRLPREPLGGAFSAGLRYAAMSPNLMKVIFRAFLFGLSAVAVLALLPLVVRNILGGSAVVYGILLGCFGIGAVVGALLNARLRTRFRSEVITRGAFVAFAGSNVTLGLSTHYLPSAVALLLAGASWVIALSLFNTTVQLSTPRWVLGRALALYQTGVFGGMAGGSWAWGVMAEGYGVSTAMLASAVVLVLGAVVGGLVPLPNLENLDLDPLNAFQEPPLRLDLRQRSGPIMILIDYEIAQDDVPAFLEAMHARRRIRIRDGAQHWTLLRDLENPDIWTETYHVPTWVEYVRHHERRTKADADSYARLVRLHRGEKLPKVHRMIERQAVPLKDDMPLKSGFGSQKQ
ncbi:MFS transporter [Sedimentitalea todarodis]|uniref:MFS transporter n=1 Tax=Sedimentitalea todarodis TaxID=1631240 RepID=A0ABU3VGI6_9RHOB|nr:MFS transporter [Sedimentitalea todarodis]MDU9005291.1 MFS transporter [Sedimentitalea todarodis]